MAGGNGEVKAAAFWDRDRRFARFYSPAALARPPMEAGTELFEIEAKKRFTGIMVRQWLFNSR